MVMQPDRQIADMGGGSALPRKNGELVFDAAWEARVFGMTISMHERQLFEWNEFRDELIEKGLLTHEELAARLADFGSGRRDDAF
jgi:hypothetical protein